MLKATSRESVRLLKENAKNIVEDMLKHYYDGTSTLHRTFEVRSEFIEEKKALLFNMFTEKIDSDEAFSHVEDYYIEISKHSDHEINVEITFYTDVESGSKNWRNRQ